MLVAVFLDRDGTMGGTGGGMHPFEFSLYEFTPAAVKALNDSGVKVFLFTNQSRVGRGYFTEQDLVEGFKMMEDRLEQQSAFLDGVYYCPHRLEDRCDCHKPNIGLLLRAAKEHNLNLKECYVVGDTGNSDMIAANKAGTKMILVKTGWGEGSLTKYRDNWKGIIPNYIAENLVDAVKWITEDLKNNREGRFLCKNHSIT